MGSLSKKPSVQTNSSSPSKLKPKQSPVKTVQAVFGDTRAVLGQVEEDVEAAIAVTDDLFLLEGVDSSNGQLRSPQSVFSDEDRDDSELDEGIHIPSKFSNKKPEEVAASLPVGIPWPAQMNSANVAQSRDVVVCEERPRDIAASIQFRLWQRVFILLPFLGTILLGTCPDPASTHTARTSRRCSRRVSKSYS